jgi:hypothetical protein
VGLCVDGPECPGLDPAQCTMEEQQEGVGCSGQNRLQRAVLNSSLGEGRGGGNLPTSKPMWLVRRGYLAGAPIRVARRQVVSETPDSHYCDACGETTWMGSSGAGNRSLAQPGLFVVVIVAAQAWQCFKRIRCTTPCSFTVSRPAKALDNRGGSVLAQPFGIAPAMPSVVSRPP